jgi:hypothetical protein
LAVIQIWVGVGIVVAAHPGQVLGREFEEQSSPVSGAGPGNGAVAEGFGEDRGAACGGAHGLDAGVGIVQIAPGIGEGKVAFVAAGNAAETALAGADGGEVVGDGDEAAVDLAVDDLVGLAGVVGGGTAVEGRADRADSLTDDMGVVVVEAMVGAEDLAEVGGEAGVVDEAAVGAAPGEEAVEALVGGGVVAAAMVELVVEDAVEFGEVAGGDRVFDHEVALQVELVLFLEVHGTGAQTTVTSLLIPGRSSLLV